MFAVRKKRSASRCGIRWWVLLLVFLGGLLVNHNGYAQAPDDEIKFSSVNEGDYYSYRKGYGYINGYGWGAYGGYGYGFGSEQRIAVNKNFETFVKAERPINDNALYFDDVLVATSTLPPDLPATTWVNYLVKKYGSGQVAWVVESDARIEGLAAMPDGGAVMVGGFDSLLYINTHGTNAYKEIVTTNYSKFFIARISANGDLLWVRTDALSTGTLPYNVLTSVTVGANGDIVAAGQKDSGATIDNHAYYAYAFAICYTAQGDVSWVRPITSFQGGADIRQVVPDNEGNYYVVGNFSGMIMIGVEQLSSNDSFNQCDVFVFKCDSRGVVQWIRRSEGNKMEMVGSACLSGDSLVFIGAFAEKTKFGSIELNGPPQTSSTDFNSRYIAWISKDGEWIQANIFSVDDGSHYYPSTGAGVAADARGHVYVMSSIFSAVTFSTTNLVVDPDSGNNFFVAEYDIHGDFLQAWQISSGGGFDISALVAGGKGEVYFSGYSLAPIKMGDLVYSSSNNVFICHIPGLRYPSVKQPPQSTGALLGQPVILHVVAGGSAPFTYQWSKDGVPVAGANSEYYYIPALRTNDLGDYTVTIKNEIGQVTSSIATVIRYYAPQFGTKPVSAGGTAGGSVVLTANAQGVPEVSLNWSRDGVARAVNTNIFSLYNLQTEDEGFYTVTAVNQAGSVAETFFVGVNMVPAERFHSFVHDPYQDVVYLSSGTNVLRYSFLTQAFLTPIALSGDLRGLDVSVDGKFLVVADHSGTMESNRVFVVKLETGEASTVSFARAPGESFNEYVAFGADGRAVITSNSRLRSYDPVTGDVITRVLPAGYRMKTSADGQAIALAATDVSSGVVQRYSVAQADVLPAIYADGRSLTELGISRSGEQIAAVSPGRAVILDQNLQSLRTIGDGAYDGPLGAAYNPVQNLVYFPWRQTSEVRVYDTVTMGEVGRFNTGTLWFTNGAFNPVGRCALTRSGDVLLVATAYGVRYVALPAQLPTILEQPRAASVAPDKVATLKVHAYSGYALSYQWQREGVDIPGATNALYTFTMAEGKEGNFRVAVKNEAGTVYSGEAYIHMTRHDPDVVWGNPADITYGTLLSVTQLNATATPPGTFTYSPPAGTRINGGLQTLQVVFVPDDLNYYEKATNTVYLNVKKRTLSISLSNTNRQYGLPNPVFTQNYAGFLPGDTLADIDQLPVAASTATEGSLPGTYPITLSGGLDNNYTFAFGTATLTVTKRVVTYTLSNTNQPYNATPRPITVTTVPEAVPLTILYNGSSTVPAAVGSYPVSIAPASVNYQGSTSGTLVITKGTATITWGPLAPINYGTPLSVAQLNATANLSGTYFYNPASGTVLPAGNQTLSVIFTPLDTVNYARSTNTISLWVNPIIYQVRTGVTGSSSEFRCEFGGVPGRKYSVQASADLQQWQEVTNYVATTTGWSFKDTSINSEFRRFYRVVLLP